MARRRAKAKNVTMASTPLGVLRELDGAVEIITGKGIASWAQELLQHYQGNVQGAETRALQPPTTEIDAYAVMGLPPTASLKEVKTRYKQLAQILHPDREGGYTEAMKRLNQAYEQIGKEKKGK